MIIIIFLPIVLLASCKSQKEATTEEMKQISSQIEKLDNIKSDNIKLIEKLKAHQSRLRAVKINAQKYRIPVLIEGRSTYTSTNELELDEMSYSLALEDLLEIHHGGKGSFRSDDPSVWKNLLIEQSREALNHIFNFELPAIQKRVDEIEKENILLKSKKRKLIEKYRTFLGKV